MSIRKRRWTTRLGKAKEAWIADYIQDGKRHIETFKTKVEANDFVSRKYISERTLRAATIIAWLELPHKIAKSMTEDEIIGMVEYDHYPIRHADGGPALHWNLRPLLRPDHKWKTKHDAADMAKERHVRMAVNEHAQRMLLKRTGGKPERRSRWPKRRMR